MKLFDSKMLVFLGIKVFFTSASFELSVTHFDIFGQKFQPTFAFFFCKIIYIWNVHINFKGTSSLSFACLYV